MLGMERMEIRAHLHLHTMERIAAAVVVLALGLPAAAQQIDASPAGKSKIGLSAPAAASRSPIAAGNSKSVLQPFGPYITQTGVGAGGADVSEAYLYGGGFAILGYGMQSSLQILVAADFSVPQSAVWTPNIVKWLSYQTGAPTTGTFTGMYMNLWNTDPTGQAPGGQFKSGGQVFQSQAWTGVYRVVEGGLSATNHAIIEVSCDGSWIGSIGPGIYWLDCTAEGTLASGPWAPPEAVPNQQPGQNPQWNGLQSVSDGAFAVVNNSYEDQDFLFQIEGASGFPTKFCSSKPSSILGCIPSLSTTSPLASKSGAPATIIAAAPVPGGAGLPGILIYSTQAPVPPISTNFGQLCLGQLQRAGSFPAVPGGTSNVCNGIYNWNVSTIAAGTAGIHVGDELRIQAWYRDPPNPPGGANFTEGLDAITIVP